ncbi:MAG: dipeptide ABC transporter ATP-binding protein [Burkholderiaceae bacterium]
MDATLAAISPGAVVMEADGLRRDYEVRRGLFAKRSVVRALNGVSFTLRAGRTLAVVGESGCGKSTLARVLTMIEAPSAGSLRLGGVDMGTAGAAQRKALRRDVQIVFQNPYGSLNPRQTVGAALEEPLQVNTPMGAADRAAAARDMMARVGLRPEFHGRYPHMFSGGQRQRVAIARALMLRPKVLVLDEPVSALDVSIRAQVLNLLADLQREFGLAYVFISHDLAVVRHIADDVLVMYLGRTVEHGPCAALFGAPQHPYTRSLLSATPIADPAKAARGGRRIILGGELPSPFAPPPGCAFHPRCPISMPACRDAVPPLLAEPEGAGEAASGATAEPLRGAHRFACIAPAARRRDMSSWES